MDKQADGHIIPHSATWITFRVNLDTLLLFYQFCKYLNVKIRSFSDENKVIQSLTHHIMLTLRQKGALSGAPNFPPIGGIPPFSPFI